MVIHTRQENIHLSTSHTRIVVRSRCGPVSPAHGYIDTKPTGHYIRPFFQRMTADPVDVRSSVDARVEKAAVTNVDHDAPRNDLAVSGGRHPVKTGPHVDSATYCALPPTVMTRRPSQTHSIWKPSVGKSCKIVHECGRLTLDPEQARGTTVTTYYMHGAGEGHDWHQTETETGRTMNVPVLFVLRYDRKDVGVSPITYAASASSKSDRRSDLRPAPNQVPAPHSNTAARTPPAQLRLWPCSLPWCVRCDRDLADFISSAERSHYHCCASYHLDRPSM
nr:hypothetical protein CFP56_69679 [Quercus suber]